MKPRVLCAFWALALACIMAQARSSEAESKPKPAGKKSGACRLPSPHYKRVKGKCRPSCGVLLAGRAGTLEAKKCSGGASYAGLSWEEATRGGRCCLNKPSSTPAPAANPGAGACDIPPLSKINVHIRGGNGSRVIADATPIVCSTDPGSKHERYCQTTMNDPNRRCCPTKPEGHPLRVACELFLLGTDTDGVPGPRWSFSGNGSVEKRSDNPFLAYAYGHGTVTACSNKVDVCGSGAVSVP